MYGQYNKKTRTNKWPFSQFVPNKTIQLAARVVSLTLLPKRATLRTSKPAHWPTHAAADDDVKSTIWSTNADRFPDSSHTFANSDQPDSSVFAYQRSEWQTVARKIPYNRLREKYACTRSSAAWLQGGGGGSGGDRRWPISVLLNKSEARSAETQYTQINTYYVFEMALPSIFLKFSSHIEHVTQARRRNWECIFFPVKL